MAFLGRRVHVPCSRCRYTSMHIRLGNVRALGYLLVGLGFLAAGTVVMNSVNDHQDWLQRHGVLAQAQVLEVYCNGEYPSLCMAHDSVRFTDGDGRSVVANVDVPELSPLRAGDYVSVKYDPNKPTSVQTLQAPESGYREFLAVMLLILAFACLAAAVGVAFRRRGRASTDRRLRGTLASP